MLSSTDLRVIELMSQNNRKDLGFNLKEFHNLIDTLIYLNETLRLEQTQIQSWQKYSETLLFKFSFHALTLHNILSGMNLKSNYFPKELNNEKILDISSAKVVLRAQIETLLMYHHIYVNPKNDDEKRLKYFAWIYSALLQRIKFSTETELGKTQKLKDEEEIDKIKMIIQGLESFKTLSKKQQKTLLVSGSGKLFNHWATILNETGFTGEHMISNMYTYLSMYAHSEGLSAIQLDSGNFKYETNKDSANLDLYISKLLVCVMISALVKLFKPVENKFKTLDKNLQIDIKFYTSLAFAK
ncbi:MAG: hypothetical protein MH132_03725 [Hydrotalea sp.]|nr:hypothetical protein [Hydrotalea sp.]